MQSLIGAVRSARRRFVASSKISDLRSVSDVCGCGGSGNGGLRLNFPAPDCVVARSGFDCSPLSTFSSSLYSMTSERHDASQCLQVYDTRLPLLSPSYKNAREVGPQYAAPLIHSSHRSMSTDVNPVHSVSVDAYGPAVPVVPRIKYKRLDKTARNIMQILDREATAEVKSQREIPDIKPGYIIQMKVLSIFNNGALNEDRYSPNIKEVKVLDKKKVRQAKLYYLREKMNPLKK